MALFRKLLRSITKRLKRIPSFKKKQKRKTRKKKSIFLRRKTSTRKSSAKGKPRRPPSKRKLRRTRRKQKKQSFLHRRPKISKGPSLKEGEMVGEITHFFSRIRVVVINMIKREVKIGDDLYIRGHTSNFVQRVRSLQVEHQDVAVAKKGQLVGLKVDKRARAGDKVYKINR